MKINSFEKSYGGVKVLSFLDFELECGKIYAVVGANGSGKSTLARVLSGIERSDGRSSPLKGVSIGYMPQKSFAFKMSVMRNLLQNGNDPCRAEKLLCDMDIAHLAKKKAQRLSGGETARMALCRLLMRDYELLILDEPTAALDISSTLLAEKLIDGYRKKTGCCVLIITHSPAQAKRLADEMLFLDKGKLLECGSPEKLSGDPERAETREFLEFFGK